MTVWHDFKNDKPIDNEELLLVKYHNPKECNDDYFIYRCGFYCEGTLRLCSLSRYDYANKACISFESEATILNSVYWARLSDIENAIDKELNKIETTSDNKENKQ